MPNRTVRIEHHSPVDATVEINGHDISDAVRGYTLTAGVGDLPHLILDIVSPTVRTTLADQHVIVDLPKETVDALVALGWTPPPADQ